MERNVESGGAALVARLRERIVADGQSVSQCAEALGISQSYLSQLLRGDKSIAGASTALLRRIAGYLHLPPVVGLLLAGVVKREDFFSDLQDELRARDRALAIIAESTFGLEACVTREMLRDAAPGLQDLVVSLYCAVIGPGKLFPECDRWSWLVQNRRD